MKAYFFMIGYGLSQTIVWLLVAFLSDSVSVLLMFLFRNLVGFVISIFKTPITTIHRRTLMRWKMHLLRASATLFGGISIFYSVTQIPVADSVAITFLAPIFGTLMSVLVLKESLSAAIVFKLIFGFSGVLVITGFSADGNLSGYLAALFGAFMTGVAYVSVKSLSDTEKPQDILYVSYLIMLPIAAGLAMYQWKTPTMLELGWLVAIGLAFYLSQILMAKAFSLAPASKLLPVDYSRIIFSSLLGLVFLNQSFSLSAYIGAFIILLTSLIRDKDIEKISRIGFFQRSSAR